MRELKFKAIYQSPYTDEPNRIFISEPYTLRQLTERGLQIDFVDGSYLMIDEMEEECTKWIQYTDRLDANGKEIYESDILSIYNEMFKKHIQYWEVYWMDDRWGLKDKYGDYDNGDFYRGDDICWEDFEVMGNIYENKDLLK